MRRAAFLLCALLAIASPARADLIVIDFNEDFPPFPQSSGPMSFDDYTHRYAAYHARDLTLEATGGQQISVYESAFANTWFEANLASVSGRSNPAVAVNGTGIMRPGGESGSFVIESDDRPFTVESMDLLMGFDNGEIGASHVSFSGYRDGILVGTLGLPLNWHGTASGVPTGAVVGWTLADLRALSGIDQLVITGLPTTVAPPNVSPLYVGNSAEFWVDNIRIHSVPEPGTLLLVGLGAALAIRRRRRSSRAVS